MKLLIIRHGIAAEREVFGKSGEPDEKRPLTAEGRRKMQRGAEGLHLLVPQVDLIAASPLLRAQQTAAIVAKEYGMGIGETTAVLTPDAPLGKFVTWIGAHAKKDVVAVVGHEPQLSMLATWLLTGLDDSRIVLKKGGACLLELATRPRRAAAVLLWLQTPGALRQIADAG